MEWLRRVLRSEISRVARWDRPYRLPPAHERHVYRPGVAGTDHRQPARRDSLARTPQGRRLNDRALRNGDKRNLPARHKGARLGMGPGLPRLAAGTRPNSDSHFTL